MSGSRHNFLIIQHHFHNSTHKRVLQFNIRVVFLYMLLNSGDGASGSVIQSRDGFQHKLLVGNRRFLCLRLSLLFHSNILV